MGRLHPSDERRAMAVYAQTHGVAFSVEPSRFMPGTVQYMIGEKPKRIVHSPARAWKLLRALARRPASPRKIPASLRAAVVGLRVLP